MEIRKRLRKTEGVGGRRKEKEEEREEEGERESRGRRRKTEDKEGGGVERGIERGSTRKGRTRKGKRRKRNTIFYHFQSQLQYLCNHEVSINGGRRTNDDVNDTQPSPIYIVSKCWSVCRSAVSPSVRYTLLLGIFKAEYRV